jgi:hypothetical protein
MEHIGALTEGELERLLSHGDQGPCVSIHLETHPAWPDSKGDRARFAGLLESAQDELRGLGLRPGSAQELLAPLRALEQEGILWRSMKRGLASFAAPGFATSFRLDGPVEDLLVIGSRFAVRPLLEQIQGDLVFYVLALGEQDVRLVRCTRDTATLVDLPPHPRSVAEATGFDLPQRGFTSHAGGRVGASGHAAITSTTGIRADERKEDVLEYCRAIDRSLHPLLRGQTAPMVLAGVDQVLRIHRQASSYPHLVERDLPGATARQTIEELRRRALPLVEPIASRERETAAQRYRQAAGTGAATDDLNLILPAARDGQVAVLLLRRGAHVWGRYDHGQRRSETHAARERGDEDLLDAAAALTIERRGLVHELAGDQMPGASPAAAILRYAVPQ